jgi:hypothetical protein
VKPRYAVYFAPPADHALWEAGCEWLARDVRTGQPHGSAPPHRRGPWRYGFHATLKAPLRLRSGAGEVQWLDAVAALAQRHTCFALPPLQVARLSGFAALRPLVEPEAGSALRRLADDCVEALDAFRAPPDDAERARRSAALAADPAGRETALLERWGYPYVADLWRFHFTLTDALPPGEAGARLIDAARAHFSEALAQPLACDALSVFVQRAPDAPFYLAWRFPLAGA